MSYLYYVATYTWIFNNPSDKYCLSHQVQHILGNQTGITNPIFSYISSTCVAGYKLWTYGEVK